MTIRAVLLRCGDQTITDINKTTSNQLSTPMAPVLVPSPPSTMAVPHTTQFSPLSHRSLDGGMLEAPSHPRKGIFGVILGSIASLAVLEGILRNIMGIWNFVHPMHVRNTAMAQYQTDVEYLEYHNKEWKDKHEAAALKAANLLRNRPVSRPSEPEREFERI
jgi:hypothetical protein